MLITDEIKRRIMQIIEDHFDGIMIKMIGREGLSREMIDELVNKGILSPFPEDENFVEDAYFVGKLRPVPKPPKISLKELRGREKEVILSDVEKYAIDNIRESAGSYISKLKNMTQTHVLETMNNLNMGYRNEILSGIIRPILEEGVLKRKMTNAIASEMRDKTKDLFRNFQRIVSTELTTAVNIGSQDAIIARHPEKTSKDIYVFKVAHDDAALCDYCRKFYLNRDGTPKVYKLSELQSNGDNYGRKARDWKATISATHPNSVVDPKTVIYTKKGWVKIKDIQNGDFVLTHKGHFKKVVGVLKGYPNPHKILYEIYYKYSSKENRNPDGIRKLVLTGDHKVLTQRGWVKICELQQSDFLIKVLKRCEICNKSMEIGGRDARTCSHECMYKLPKDLSGIHGENNKSRVYDQIARTVSNKWKQGYYKETLKVLQSTEHRRKNKENMLNGGALKALKGNLRISKPQIKLYRLVRKEYPTAQLEFGVFNKSLDIAIPELKIDIEYDGEYWHKNRKEYDDSRDDLLRDNGWHVLRYVDVPNRKQIQQDIGRVLQNSNHSFHFEELKIEWIHRIYSSKKHKLYDITVEDDESFIARGVVIHNCRCEPLVYIAEGWDFDKKTKELKFVGQGKENWRKKVK